VVVVLMWLPLSFYVLLSILDLIDNGEVKVTKQVVVLFSIGKYIDKVLCDVVQMQESHILLGETMAVWYGGNSWWG